MIRVCDQVGVWAYVPNCYKPRSLDLKQICFLYFQNMKLKAFIEIQEKKLRIYQNAPLIIYSEKVCMA